MATNTHKTDAGQKDSNDKHPQIVAVYRFVIIENEARRDDSPEHGIWISKDNTGKKYTHTAYLRRYSWEATFGCIYKDTGVIETLEILEILDLSDSFKGKTDWKPKLGFPSKTEGKKEDDNGNDLLRFSLIRHPLGLEGGQQETRAAWWAKKEYWNTFLTEAELERFEFDEKIVYENVGPIEPTF